MPAAIPMIAGAAASAAATAGVFGTFFTGALTSSLIGGAAAMPAALLTCSSERNVDREHLA